MLKPGKKIDESFLIKQFRYETQRIMNDGIEESRSKTSTAEYVHTIESVIEEANCLVFAVELGDYVWI